MTSRRSSKRKSKSPAPTRVPRSLFDFRPVLEGEDAAAYDELIRGTRQAVHPVDFIDEIYVADVTFLEWEVIRWRRLKFRLMQAHMHDALLRCLTQHLGYDTYKDIFAEFLTQILHESKNLSEEQARELAYQYANSQAEAMEVTRLLNAADLKRIERDAAYYTAKELIQKSVRRESAAVQLIDQLLRSEGRTRDDIMLDTFSEKIDEIERLDRQIATAEARRNISLREIERRRAMLGEALQRILPEVELRIIETTPSSDKEST
ncbi:hypothetical protein IVA80_22520 [Bradyrhizobium sp. 139]|uniref:hypothetical protein n=1 Tax=Bradyrhizobium sp. 139 TaxID=2782616 RepID=UPI001FF81615|nr:hypothetical protein [Bradyrhizobium sp. 139]MCK1743543.1 hypothetical protein [Bradyrhizobium sp. 139]